MQDFIWKNKHYFISKHDVKGNTYNCLREGGYTNEYSEVKNAKSILIEFIENKLEFDDDGNKIKPIVKTICGVKASPTTHELIRIVLKMN